MAESAQSITLLTQAIRYAERGWSVFPVHSAVDGKCSCGRVCGRPAKHPRTSNGWKDATNDRERIKRWWNDWPEANIGIACGPSRIIVIDVDPRNGGDESLSELEVAHGPLPRTLTALTGGGGQHFYYDVSGIDAKLPGRVLAQGIELQAAGQYVLAPPSMHISGRAYQWDVGQADSPEFPPSWLTDENRRRARWQEAAGEVLEGIIGTAFSAAGMLGPPLGPDRACVQCPWEDGHSQGARFDSSTVVFGPVGKGKWGWFHCSHASCRERLSTFRGVERMHEVLRALPEKAAQYASDRLAGAEREIRRVVRAPWEESLVWDKKGNELVASAGNLRLMVENMAEWAGSLAYDESKDRLAWTRKPPEVQGMPAPLPDTVVQEYDWIYVSHWFAKNRRSQFPKELVSDVLVTAAKGNPRNSLDDYLKTIQWDGVRRLDTWLPVYCAALDNDHTRAVGRAWMISAIARALDPGCQCDHVLVLEGKQGAGKTSVFRVLGGEWYIGNLPRLEDKDARHILSGAWIVEIQELAAMRGSSIERVKAYITERWDTYRPPYHRNFVKRPRRCVFGASTNEGEYVPDPTGARRFWPVWIDIPDIPALERDRSLLWAEAREAFLSGERWWFTAKDVVSNVILEEQSRRQNGDPWDGRVENYVKSKLESGVTAADILISCIGIEPGRQGVVEARRVGDILRRLGWSRAKRTLPDGRREWYFTPRSGRIVE